MTERVVVMGAGVMGSGIAQLAAQAGFGVILVDVGTEPVQRALATMRSSLERLEAKGLLDEPAAEVLARVVTLTDPEAPLPHAAEVMVALEAVLEDADLKRQVLRSLEARLGPKVLLATNTSGLPVGELATALEDPGRLVGLHFFNPPTRMPVVEVVRGPATRDALFHQGVTFVERLGKDPLRVEEDLPGFVLNRIAMAASNEAIRLVELGVATPAAIDAGVRGAFGWKMGPLETADLVGLDVVWAARMGIYQRTGDAKFKPPELVKRLVDEGKLGKKSGAGFYDYDP